MGRNKIVLIVAILFLSIAMVWVFFGKGFKTGGIRGIVAKSYGSVIFSNNPEGIKCWDYSADRVEFDYSSVVGSADYSKGYLSLKSDDGDVDKITCSYIDNSFIEVFPASPSESFEDVGYEDWGPLAEDESVIYEYHITVVGGLSWTSGTEKSIAISCDIDNCDTTVGEGNCDFFEEINFYHATTETCS